MYVTEVDSQQVENCEPYVLFYRKQQNKMPTVRAKAIELMQQKEKSLMQFIVSKQARIAWGVHGLLKVSLRPAMPDHPTPCGRPHLKRPFRYFRVGRPQYGRLTTISLPPWNTPCHTPLSANSG
jgi:hypothetical protein